MFVTQDPLGSGNVYTLGGTGGRGGGGVEGAFVRRPDRRAPVGCHR